MTILRLNFSDVASCHPCHHHSSYLHCLFHSFCLIETAGASTFRAIKSRIIYRTINNTAMQGVTLLGNLEIFRTLKSLPYSDPPVSRKILTDPSSLHATNKFSPRCEIVASNTNNFSIHTDRKMHPADHPTSN